MVDARSVAASYALVASFLTPVAGTLLIFFIGGFRTHPAKTPQSWPGIFAVALSALSIGLSIFAGIATRNGAALITQSGEWIPGFGPALSFQLDWLSAWLLILLDVIGLMVNLFSIGYMKEEPDQRRYFGGLLFFIANMKLLLLAGSYLLLFAGWEGVGLASYLLIGYHFERPQAADAATKAFIVNRIGDAGFVLAIIAMTLACGSTNYTTVSASASHIPHGSVVLIGSLLVVAAVGKSAQFPLHVWLPDAMEGPTPVSALIHSATMVCAGVYLLARSNFLYVLAPEVGFGVAITGAVTALFAASVALVENDIKRVLAYSTISQIGFMFMALGLGADRAAMYHVATHAFFKSLLFLCAGSVIHALHGEQNLKHMGGLRKELPVTFTTMCVAALTLAGLPGLAGYFSKDLILGASFESGYTPLAVIGLLTSLLTAIYSWRLISLAFLSHPRRHRLAAHEGTASMQIPMAVLAACCVLAGWLFVPIPWTGWRLMLGSAGIALAGIAIAWHYYVRHPEARAGLDQRFGPVAAFLRNRWFVDAVFEEHFLEGVVLRTAKGAAMGDALLIDGSVNGIAASSREFAAALSWSDGSIIDGTVRAISGFARFLSWPVRAFQTGFLQTYASIFLVIVLAALGYYLAR
ncbi:MAG: NADH-quinone oxidoreductase subunit L [Acidobacteriaceae bacterium]|nr:NADH-quinone oxidoreductase subunit L [Acidobacteriaceae bacterium]